MSSDTTFKCDGCQGKKSNENPYVPPDGWRTLIGHSVEWYGKQIHACSADCVVKVLRADATALEAQERARKMEAEDHAQRAEAERLRGLAIAERMKANAEEAKQKHEDAIAEETRRRAGKPS